MQSWRLLQLEPSSLRRSDPFTAPTKLGLDGSHLAATLYHLARAEVEGERDESRATPAVYDRIANRLAELIGDVRSVTVDRDDRRELLTVTVTGRDGTSHPARALSDGTLRFLALSVLEADPHATGLLCLEEPENGIHPARIGAILSLLESIAVDTSEEIGPDNPLRQVIVNTHSPRVVAGVREEDVLFAELKEKVLKDGKRFKRLSFSCLSGTWRAATGDAQVVSKGLVLEYWSPGYPFDPQTQRERRVCQRQDLQQLSLGFGDRK
jgi:predicted ATPase